MKKKKKKTKAKEKKERADVDRRQPNSCNTARQFRPRVISMNRNILHALACCGHSRRVQASKRIRAYLDVPP